MLNDVGTRRVESKGELSPKGTPFSHRWSPPTSEQTASLSSKNVREVVRVSRQREVNIWRGWQLPSIRNIADLGFDESPVLSDTEGSRYVDQVTEESKAVLVVLESTNGLVDPNPAAVLDGVGGHLLRTGQVGSKAAVGLAEDLVENGGVVAEGDEARHIEVFTEGFDTGVRSLCPNKLDG